MSNQLKTRPSMFVQNLASVLPCGVLLFGWVSNAQAQSEQPYAARSSMQMEPVWTGYHLKRNPGISVGLESYAGLAVLSTEDGSRGHGIVGGLSRLRVSYFELGADLEVSDMALVRWRQAGGFVGAYLPLVNWVDIDTTIGLAQRTYSNSDTQYGPGGLQFHNPTMTFRLGFSDRLIDELAGFRMGAALLVGVDLKHQQAAWQYAQEGQSIAYGVTRVGGYSVGLIVTLGFDVMLRRASER